MPQTTSTQYVETSYEEMLSLPGILKSDVTSIESYCGDLLVNLEFVGDNDFGITDIEDFATIETDLDE